MTPKEVLELSEPVEQVYTDCVAQLIQNICRHLGQGKSLSTMEWELRKLSEMDALTRESIKIIASYSGKAEREIKSAIAKGLKLSVKDVESVLKGAVKAGTIAGIGFSVEESQALKNALESLTAQAVDRANLVNTVMLNSTRQRYLWAVNSTKDYEQQLIERLMTASNAEQLEKQLGKVQTALNTATSSVLVGAESRTQALSRVIKQLAAEGITGYIDAGGHHWSPEAYMNMDIRTTIHNTAIQAQKERAAEYGVQTFQISSHSGARPLCAPYQGKFYSWDGSEGTITDLDGHEFWYESIQNTSYGEPAGIFGINCGHFPQTFVDGYSIPRFGPTEDEEKNAKEYAESQKQRQLERNVRQAKLEAIAQDAAGNKEAFKTAAEKVRQANADYKAYCKETGRTPRNDRLQVYASPDGQSYNRSMSGKVTGTTRGWKPPENPQGKQISIERAEPKHKAKTLSMYNEAVEWAKEGFKYDIDSLREGWQNVKSQIDAIDAFEKETPQYEKALRDAVLREDFSIRTTSADVERILADGRIKTQIETGASNGYLDVERRKRTTEELFAGGDNLSLNSDEYEVYGYLGNAPRAKMYGDVRIVLNKDKLIDRTTLTVGDSLELLETGGDPMPTMAKEPSIISYGRIFSESVPNAPQRLRDVRNDFKSISENGYLSGGNYVELQFHGGVTTNDISYIELSRKDGNAEAISKLAEEQGVKIKWK